MDDPLDDLTLCGRAILGYEGFPEVLPFVVYGGIRLNGDCLEIDFKDDETEEFFKSLVEHLLRIGSYCSKSPLINYGGCYMVRCRADLQEKLSLIDIVQAIAKSKLSKNPFSQTVGCHIHRYVEYR